MTLDDLAACYERAGLRYRRDDAHGALESVQTGYNGTYRLKCAVLMDGTLLRLLVRTGEYIPEQRRESCLEALLVLNGSLVLGCYGCDLRRGEITVCQAVLLGENALTQQRFEHVFFGLMATVDMNVPVFKEIIWGHVSLAEAIAHAEREWLEPKAGALDPWAEVTI